MKQIIWNANELKHMKKIFQRKLTISINENNELTQKTDNQSMSVIGGYTKKLINNLGNEIEELFYTNNTEEINKVLEKASMIKADSNNKLHYGFITVISKVDKNNKAEIFTVFNEIISLHEHFIHQVAQESIENIEDFNEIKAKITSISKRDELPIEYFEIKNRINAVFNYSNGVVESPLFKNLLTKLDSMIVSKLVVKMNSILATKIKRDEQEKQNDYTEYRNGITKKYQKDHLESIKYTGGKIYYSK